jgi:Tol biopolymer transport system component
LFALQGAQKEWSLAAPIQLSDNGKEKQQLVLGGKVLYFGQAEDGRYGLAAMSVNGGAVRTLWSPPANVEPIAVSPDGRNLIATVALGDEDERQLWIYPLPDGPAHRLSNITAHDAAWAPGGELIAYAAGDAVYLIEDGQATPRQIGSFAHNAMHLQWSSDGTKLRFFLVDSTNTFVAWGELAGIGFTTATIHPLSTRVVGAVSWTPGDADDSQIFVGTPVDSNRNALWEMRFANRWWEQERPPVPISRSVILLGGVAFDQASRRLYVLSQSVSRDRFEKLDPRTQEFKQVLPGIAGAFLDYSPSGAWVAYSTTADLCLWISKADGTSARQLTFPPESVQLSRWSPDGTRVAFMKSRPGHPWRIYVQNVDGGPAREASTGEDGQGAPTWSPDGKYIAYGGVVCEKTGTCAIHRIDLATGKTETLPGSEGLFTARWSPDGRWIAAINLNEHQLMLFDVKAWKWHKLADGMNGDDLSWSSDSKYLFTNIHGPEARIVRVRATDGSEETVFSSHMMGKAGPTQDDDLLFSLAPDDSLVLHNRAYLQEAFAYDIR